MITETIGILRQVQHLLLIRDEAAKVGSGDKLDALAASVAKLTKELDGEALALYTRLSARNRIFMSPLSKGNCSACGIRVPTSELQHVIGKDRFVVCANCGRILYLPDVKATGLRAGTGDTKFLLSRFSAPSLMIANMRATTKEAAIAELCDRMARENILSDPEKVVDGALAREKILTTAVGSGLAFPHMRGIEEGVLTLAVGVSKPGIDWGDGNVVNLIVFTALPIVASPFYIKLLSAFATTFEGGSKLPFIVAAEDSKSLWKELNKAMRVALKDI